MSASDGRNRSEIINMNVNHQSLYSTLAPDVKQQFRKLERIAFKVVN